MAELAQKVRDPHRAWASLASLFRSLYVFKRADMRFRSAGIGKGVANIQNHVVVTFLRRS